MMDRSRVLIPILLACCAPLAGCGGGGANSSDGVPVDSNPPPPPSIFLSALQPDKAQEGGAPFTLTVTGVDFTKSSQVIWNGQSLPTTYVSSKELQAPVTTADTAPQSGVLVTVSTPGYVCNSCGLNFELDLPPNPTIASTSPSGMTDGSPQFTLKVMGTGFIPASSVTWNGKSLPTTYVSGQELDATVPANAVSAVGTAAISVQDAVQGYYLPNTVYYPIGYTMTVLDMPANDLAWDPADGLIYISLKADASHNSSIATYDPATGAVGTLAVTTPFEADRLAISGDDSLLYAGYDSNSQVVRFTLPGGTLDESIDLPPTGVGRAYAIDIEVQPGAPHSFATVIGASGLDVTDPIGGIQIYDDTTPRPNALPNYSPHQIYDSTSIQWSADGTKLYGADGVDTDFTFFIMDVDSTGITSTAVYNNVFGYDSAFYTEIKLDPATGYLFGSDTTVVDPTVPDYVYISDCLGYYALPDDTTGRAYYLNSSQIPTLIDTYSLFSCDKATGKLISIINLPAGQLFPTSFIRFGTDGLAFTTADGKVILVQGHFVAP